LLLFITGQHKQLLPNDNTYGFPSRYFYETLVDYGFSWSGDRLDADFLISINHNSGSYANYIRAGHRRENCILVQTEPEAVYPSQYTRNVENLYGLVFSPGRLGHPNFIHQFYEFQETPGGPSFAKLSTRERVWQSIQSGNFDPNRWSARGIPLAMIASNKFSPLKNNGYNLRRQVASAIPNDKITIYGQNWNDNFIERLNAYLRMYIFNLRNKYLPQLNLFQLKSYVGQNIGGEIELKSKILPSIKFLLIIENSLNVFTEKFFDALLMGVIPIYVGPNLDIIGIPQSTYLRVDSNVYAIRDLFEELDEINYFEYLEEIQKFVSSDFFFNTWCDRAPYQKMTQIIQRYINSQQTS
jgi:hypothetical protein